MVDVRLTNNFQHQSESVDTDSLPTDQFDIGRMQTAVGEQILPSS